MSLTRPRPRPIVVSHGPRKKVDFEPLPNVGNLSPDLQPNTPPVFQRPTSQNVLKIGKYLLFDHPEGSEVYSAVNSITGENCVCKVFEVRRYREVLSAYWQVDNHEHINSLSEIILGQTKAYVFFEKNYGDLHSYVRQKKRLKEEEAARLFRQILSAVEHCHANGIILRDLKLRKFVFKDSARTHLRLDGLEDAVVLDEETNDLMTDKHGCPAYVSPEILGATGGAYSGKAADVWSLGVMLYTMLVGRYPFHDSQPLALFGKIKRGQFSVPDSVAPKAKCLLRSLLRREPSERLCANQISQHPWFKGHWSSGVSGRASPRVSSDQTVPDVPYFNETDSFYL
ncbi:tribbles homolog 2-like [Gigantopelta aegis]|uniref:tribbles homolog 2-like n=1 Tax=Gigantopelta aegis TaxID=1735272 RepID=UPI001B88ABDE|nr:tribbles homolog 2-like [Gigantopelta aegis]